MLMVVAHLEQELAGLRRARRHAAPGAPSWELHVVGVGRLAGHRVKTLLEAREQRPQGVLLLGFAGALDSSLDTGHLVVARRYFCGGAPEPLEADGELWREGWDATDRAGLARWPLDSLTVDHLVASSGEKQALVRRYPVGTVNMEDYWVAEAAQAAGVPFLSVRAVLDVSTQRLPSFLLELPGSRTRAALSLATRPWRLPAALLLARQAAVASAALTRFALEFSPDRGRRGPGVGPTGPGCLSGSRPLSGAISRQESLSAVAR